MSSNSAGTIKLDLEVGSNNLQGQITNSVGQAMKKSTTSIGSSLKSTLGNIGKIALAGFSIKKAFDFSKEAIELGSDLAEVQNVVDSVFTSMSKDVNDFAKASISAYGLSETVAKKYIGTFGAMAKSFGFTESQALNMSETLTGLAGDVASFYDMSQDEAYTKLKSVFTGETESLKELGVVMTQNALDSFALANGYSKLTSQMTEAEKVALRYAFVQNQLSTASGDFARTSGSWANQIRVLKLQFQSLQAQLGQGFIAVLTPIIKYINILIGKLVTLATVFNKVMTSLFGSKNATSSAASGISDIASASDDVSTSVGDIGDSTSSAAKKIKKSLMGFDKLNKLSSNDDTDTSAGTSSGVGSSISGLNTDFSSLNTNVTPDVDTSKLESKMKKLKDSVKNWFSTLPKLQINADWTKVLSDFKSGFKSFFKAIANFTHMLFTIEIKIINDLNVGKLIEKFSEVFKSVGKLAEIITDVLEPAMVIFYDTALKPIVKWIGEKLAKSMDIMIEVFDSWGAWFKKYKPDIINFFTVLGTIVGVLFEVLKPILNILIKMNEIMFKLLTYNVQQLLGLILNPKKEIERSLKLLKSIIPESLSTMLNDVVTYLTSVYDNVTTYFSEIINSVITFFSGIINKITEFGAMITELLNEGKELIVATWNSIKEIINTVINFISTSINTIKTTIINIITTIKNTISDIVNGIKTTITNIINGIHSTITSTLNSIRDTFSNIFNNISSNVSGIFNNIKNAIINAMSSAKNAIGGILGQIRDSFSNVFSSIPSILKAPLNSATSLANKAIKGLNNLKVSIPSWIPDIGGKSFGFNIPSIPALANGGYVKANTPQLAMIGDNRHEGEIVTPESKITEAVKQETQPILNAIETLINKLATNTNNNTGDIIIPVTLGGEAIDTVILKAQNRQTYRSGGKV